MMVLAWIVAALLLSFFAKLIFGVGKLLFWLVFGIIGASLGGWIGAVIGIGAIALFGIPGLLTALLGAAVFLGIGRLVRGLFIA